MKRPVTLPAFWHMIKYHCLHKISQNTTLFIASILSIPHHLVCRNKPCSLWVERAANSNRHICEPPPSAWTNTEGFVVIQDGTSQSITYACCLSAHFLFSFFFHLSSTTYKLLWLGNTLHSANRPSINRYKFHWGAKFIFKPSIGERGKSERAKEIHDWQRELKKIIASKEKNQIKSCDKDTKSLI